MSENNQTTRNIAQQLVAENLEQTRIIEEQDQQILELQNALARLNEKMPEIEDLQDSFAVFSDQVDDKFKNIAHHKPKPVMAFLMIGVGFIGFFLAMGLNLEGKIGESRISYKGEGVTSAIVQIVLSAVGGGAIAKNIDPIKDFFINSNN